MVFEHENVLFRCCREGLQEELVQQIQEGQDVNVVENSRQNGCFMYRTISDVECTVQSNRGMTPLMYAAIRNFVEGVRVLIYNGAIINQVDDIGFTALKYAEQNTSDDVIQLLNSDEVTNIALAQEANQQDWPQSQRNPSSISPYFQDLIINNNQELNRLRQQDLNQINNLLEESHRILDRRNLQLRARNTYLSPPGVTFYNQNQGTNTNTQRSQTYDSSNIYRVMNHTNNQQRPSERNLARNSSRNSQVQGVRNRPRWNNSTSIDYLPQINQIQSYQPHSFINTQNQRELQSSTNRQQRQPRQINYQRRRATSGQVDSPTNNESQNLSRALLDTDNYNSDNEMGFDQNRLRNQEQEIINNVLNTDNYNSDNEFGFNQNRLVNQVQQNNTSTVRNQNDTSVTGQNHNPTLNTSNYNSDNEMGYDQNRVRTQNQNRNTQAFNPDNYNSDNEMGFDQNRLRNQTLNQNNQSSNINNYNLNNEVGSNQNRVRNQNQHRTNQVLDTENYATSNETGLGLNGQNRPFQALQPSWFIPSYETSQRLSRLNLRTNAAQNQTRTQQQTSQVNANVQISSSELRYDPHINSFVNANGLEPRNSGDGMVLIDLSNRQNSMQVTQNSGSVVIDNQTNELGNDTFSSNSYAGTRNNSPSSHSSSVGVDTNDLQILMRSTMTQYDNSMMTQYESLEDGRYVVSVEVQTDIENECGDSAFLDQCELTIVQQLSLEEQLQSTCVKQDIYIAEQMQALMYLDEVH